LPRGDQRSRGQLASRAPRSEYTAMNIDGSIPFLDLVTPHRELEEQLVSVFRRALSTAAFVGGPMVDEFERQFAAFCAVDHCVGVASGTDALRFALIAA